MPRGARNQFPRIGRSRLPLAPQSPQACFDLVLGIPYDAGCMEAVRRLKNDADELGRSGPFSVEHFLALQTYLVALPRLLQMPVPDSIKRQFCITCRDIASTLQQPDHRLALAEPRVPRARSNRECSADSMQVNAASMSCPACRLHGC